MMLAFTDRTPRRSATVARVTNALASTRSASRAVAVKVLPRSVKRRLRALPLVGRAAGRAGGRAPSAPRNPSHIPTDHARQIHSHYYIEEAMTGPNPPRTVVDLGCGNGASAELFRQWQPDVNWIGVDIQDSDLAKGIVGEKVFLYDGVNLPFPDDTVPLLYTNQVFEHVRYPEPLLREIRRVLAPGGVFIGSTSQLEPYHAFSLWGGYTIYGWRTLCEAAGLVLEEARPSIDAIALITRVYEGAEPRHNAWWTLSPLNEDIDAWAERTGADVATTNARKLQFSGQFAFRVRKPATGSALARATRARRRLGLTLLRAGERLVG